MRCRALLLLALHAGAAAAAAVRVLDGERMGELIASPLPALVKFVWPDSPSLDGTFERLADEYSVARVDGLFHRVTCFLQTRLADRSALFTVVARPTPNAPHSAVRLKSAR